MKTLSAAIGVSALSIAVLGCRHQDDGSFSHLSPMGFTIRLPAGWELSSTLASPRTDYFAPAESERLYPPLSIRVLPDETSDLEQLAEQPASRELTVGGEKAVMLPSTEPVLQRFVYLQHGSDLWEVRWIFEPDSVEEDESVLEDILASFRFTD